MAEANNESVGGTNSNDVPPADIQEEETGQESDAVTPELKEFLDSYESFMNDYCDFMATYDSSDMTALIKYASLMESYAEFMDKADDYDTDDMSAADAKYYIDTMARIEKRMIDATYNSGY